MDKILIWDWDGTLADTLDYKYVHIWKDIFPDDENVQKHIIDFIQTPEGKGLNRYGLVREALNFIGRNDLTDLSDDEFKNNFEVVDIISTYDELAKEWVYSKGLFPGVREMLKNLHSEGYSMYLVSGGGSDEDMVNFLTKTDLRKYFKGAFGFGAPGTKLGSFGKDANFTRIKERENKSDSSSYIFIGDANTDQKFSEFVDAEFIGVASKWNGWQVGGEGFPVVENVAQVFDYIQRA